MVARPGALCLFITLSIVLYIITSPPEEASLPPSRGLQPLSPFQKPRVVVGYTLLAKVQEESREYRCESNEGEFRGGEVSDKVTAEAFNGWMEVKGMNLWVYGVYYDDRLEGFGYVRIVAMVRGKFNKTLYCQTGENETHHITKASIKEIWSPNWNNNDETIYFNPVLISCRILTSQNPNQITLSRSPCTKDVTLQIRSISAEKNNFTLCVKPLAFKEDISKRLLQWLEINKLLGASKFEIYVDSLHINVLKLLKWYSTNVSLVVRRHKIINYDQDKQLLKRIWQKRRYEIVVYTDCLYRNLHSNYIIPIDIDEIIVPRIADTWYQLLNRTLNEETRANYASFTVQNAFYSRTNPASSATGVFFFRDLLRTAASERGESGKSFISTKNALTVFNHYALDVLRPGTGTVFFLPADEVQMNHYKKSCHVFVKECVKYFASSVRIVDAVILKYKDLFYSSYRDMLEKARRIGII